MKFQPSRTLVLGAITAAVSVGWSMAYAQDVPPGYNTPIPENIMTPDTVDSVIGTLNFVDGMPTAETSKLVYDNLDLLRGVETFLNGIPATSVAAMRLGQQSLGAIMPNQVMIMDEFLDSGPLFLTGNTGTVYASSFLDLGRDGPTVIEVPPGMGPGTIDDAFFRFVIDLGGPGPDKGKGGKYLILPPGYEGDVPDGYFVATSLSYINWVILRGLIVDNKPDVANKTIKEGLKIYPLSQIDAQPKMEFFSTAGKSFNTIHANDFDFYAELAEVVNREHIGFLDAELRGLFASVGIEKGKPFAPDERMTSILTESAKVANATARAIAFDTRDKNAYLFPDSAWKTAFIGGDYRWLKDDGNGGRNLDARILFFYQATVNTPAMAWEIPGIGSSYALAERDSNWDYLDGGKNYKLTIPANVPAKNFWSIVVYDAQTRSELQTSQPLPSKNSARGGFDTNADGSTDLYFGPKSPTGKERNWIATVEGKSWFTYLRLYGPGETWFDRTWKPSEIMPQ